MVAQNKIVYLLLNLIFASTSILAETCEQICNLKQVGSLIDSGGFNPSLLRVSPNNNCLYVVNSNLAGGGQTSGVAAFKINQDCTIEKIESLNVNGLLDIAFSNINSCFALVNSIQVQMFKISDKCVISKTQQINLKNAQSLSFSPDGNCLAVLATNPSTSESNLNLFSVLDCKLSLNQTVKVLESSTQVAFSPKGNCLAILNSIKNKVTFYEVLPDCKINSVGKTLDTRGTNVISFNFSPDGNCLGVLNAGSNNIVTFALKNCNVISTNSISFKAIEPRNIAFSADGKCLFLADASNEQVNAGKLHLFCVNDCKLTLAKTVVTNGTGSTFIAASPNNKCVYVANFNSNNITVFSKQIIVAQPIISSVKETCLGQLEIAGTTTPQATVKIFLNNIKVGTTKADAQGIFNFITQKLSNGSFEIVAQAEINGISSQLSRPVVAQVKIPTLSNITQAIIFKYCPSCII